MAGGSHCTQNELMEARTKRDVQKEFDGALLIEVATLNPYRLGNVKKGSGWRQVAERMSLHMAQPVTERRVRERTDDILKNFKKRDIQKARSGIEENYSEEDKLLLDLLEMKAAADEEKVAQKGTVPEKDKDRAIGEKVLEGCLRRASVSDPSAPVAKKHRTEMLSYFREKDLKQQAMQSEQLAIIKEALALRLQAEERQLERAQEERQMQLELLRIQERMAEEDRKLRREEMAQTARREEEERKLRMEELRLRDRREREASERQTEMFSALVKMLGEKNKE